jgi:hypothetical protein
LRSEQLAEVPHSRPGSNVDPTVAAAVHEAGVAIVSAPSFKEELLHDALEPALDRRLRPARVVRCRKVGLESLPDWNPQPQAIDISVLSTAGEVRLAFELKVDEIGQTLWDMLKMAAAARLPSVDRAYLVVAASKRSWERGRRAGRRYFQDPPGRSSRATLDELFAEFRHDWKSDLRYTARPTRVPETLDLTAVARAEVPAWSGYELRVLAVRDRPGTDFRAIKKGWPVGVQS